MIQCTTKFNGGNIMNINDLDLVLQKQKEYFNSGITLDINFRIKMLKRN